MAVQQHGQSESGSYETVQLLEALSRLIRSWRAVSQHAPEEYGMSGTPLGILKTLAQGDARLGDLAGRLQIAPSVVSRAVTPLEQAGLVERRVDPKDARAVPLGITALGRRRLDEARRMLAEQFAALLHDWDRHNVLALTSLLDRLELTLSTTVEHRSSHQVRRARRSAATSPPAAHQHRPHHHRTPQRTKAL